MRGVVSHWVFNGYKRIMAQAPYFVIPIGLGKLVFPRLGLGRSSAARRYH